MELLNAFLKLLCAFVCERDIQFFPLHLNRKPNNLRGWGHFLLIIRYFKIQRIWRRDEKFILSVAEGSLEVYPERRRRACTLRLRSVRAREKLQ